MAGLPGPPGSPAGQTAGGPGGRLCPQSIDLIPDFIPVLGYLDDLILLPLGILLVVKMIPDDVLADCRARAKEASLQKETSGAVLGTVLVVVFWVILAAALFFIAKRMGLERLFS